MRNLPTRFSAYSIRIEQNTITSVAINPPIVFWKILGFTAAALLVWDYLRR